MLTVWDQSSKKLILTTSGLPMMVVTLPTGKYDVEATYRGDMKLKTIEVGPKSRERGVFMWEQI